MSDWPELRREWYRQAGATWDTEFMMPPGEKYIPWLESKVEAERVRAEAAEAMREARNRAEELSRTYAGLLLKAEAQAAALAQEVRDLKAKIAEILK